MVLKRPKIVWNHERIPRKDQRPYTDQLRDQRSLITNVLQVVQVGGVLHTAEPVARFHGEHPLGRKENEDAAQLCYRLPGNLLQPDLGRQNAPLFHVVVAPGCGKKKT